MLQARIFCAVTVLGADVVVMGGMTSGATKSMERYNRRSQCWKPMPSLPRPLTLAAAIVVRV